MSTRCHCPITLKSGDHVPCGRCPACHARRISGWSFRLMQEERQSLSAHFITLTYAPKNVRRSPLGGRLTLVKRDIQLFFKKLRKSSYWGDRIKYFVVGEYGSNYSRPHYHAIVFNCPSLELYQPCWPHGHIHYGKVSGASVGYCLKYMCKVGAIPQYKGDDRTPEFGLFSKGLGASYLTPDMIRWHLDELTKRCYIPMPGGKKIAMPRYFKERIYTKGQRLFIQLYMTKGMFEEYKSTYQSKVSSVRDLAFMVDRRRFESDSASRRKERARFIQGNVGRVF